MRWELGTIRGDSLKNKSILFTLVLIVIISYVFPAVATKQTV